MSRLYKADAMRALVGLALMGESMMHDEPGHVAPINRDGVKRLIKRQEQGNKYVALSNGAKEWTIDGITVIARDEKNAIRKVERIKSL